MQPPAWNRRIDDLVHELAQYHGYRTVWIDLDGHLVHAEPDNELERKGFLYVLTALRPAREELLDAVARFVTVASARPSVAAWSPAESVDLGTPNLASA